MVCEEDLAARVFRSWGKHADPAGGEETGVESAGGQLKLQAVPILLPSTTAAAGPTMLPGRAKSFSKVGNIGEPFD